MKDDRSGETDSKARNITPSADRQLIDAARQRARDQGTTLNSQYRQWLEDYVGRDRAADAAMDTVSRLPRTLRTEGRRFLRDELNER